MAYANIVPQIEANSDEEHPNFSHKIRSVPGFLLVQITLDALFDEDTGLNHAVQLRMSQSP